MGYASEAGIAIVFNTFAITDALDDNRDDAADSGLMAGSIEDADFEAESYIVGPYPTYTIDYAGTMPGVLKLMADRLAAANMLMRQGRGREATWREETIEWFEKLAEGTVNLPDASTSSLPTSTTHEIEQVISYRSMDPLGEPSPRNFETGDENSPLD